MRDLILKKKSTSGQALIEYALLLAIAAGVSLSFTSFFSNATKNGIFVFNAVLEKELATGSFANKLNIWQN